MMCKFTSCFMLIIRKNRAIPTSPCRRSSEFHSRQDKVSNAQCSPFRISSVGQRGPELIVVAQADCKRGQLRGGFDKLVERKVLVDAPLQQDIQVMDERELDSLCRPDKPSVSFPPPAGHGSRPYPELLRVRCTGLSWPNRCLPCGASRAPSQAGLSYRILPSRTAVETNASGTCCQSRTSAGV